MSSFREKGFPATAVRSSIKRYTTYTGRISSGATMAIKDILEFQADILGRHIGNALNARGRSRMTKKLMETVLRDDFGLTMDKINKISGPKVGRKKLEAKRKGELTKEVNKIPGPRGVPLSRVIALVKFGARLHGIKVSLDEETKVICYKLVMKALIKTMAIASHSAKEDGRQTIKSSDVAFAAMAFSVCAERGHAGRGPHGELTTVRRKAKAPKVRKSRRRGTKKRLSAEY